MNIHFQFGDIAIAEIEKYLIKADKFFIPALSEKVNIKAFATKFHNNGIVITAVHNNNIIGLLAFYCNDMKGKLAFITNMSVLPEFYGKGIAAKMMNHCVKYVIEKNFIYIGLEVNKLNERAISFYIKYDFKIEADHNESHFMKKYLNVH